MLEMIEELDRNLELAENKTRTMLEYTLYREIIEARQELKEIISQMEEIEMLHDELELGGYFD